MFRHAPWAAVFLFAFNTACALADTPGNIAQELNDILPNACLKLTEQDKNCPWPKREFNIKPDFDPCGGCVIAQHRCPVSYFSTDKLQNFIEKYIKDHGKKIYFNEHSLGVFIILTEFTGSSRLQQTYRIRVETQSLPGWTPSPECQFYVSIDSLKFPLVNGKRDMLNSTSVEDDFTKGLGEALDQFSKELSEKAIVVDKQKENSVRDIPQSYFLRNRLR